MKRALNAAGYPVGRRKTRTLMREAQVLVRRYRKKYKVTTNSDHKKPVFENVLNRQFQVADLIVYTFPTLLISGHMRDGYT